MQAEKRIVFAYSHAVVNVIASCRTKRFETAIRSNEDPDMESMRLVVPMSENVLRELDTLHSRQELSFQIDVRMSNNNALIERWRLRPDRFTSTTENPAKRCILATRLLSTAIRMLPAYTAFKLTSDMSISVDVGLANTTPGFESRELARIGFPAHNMDYVLTVEYVKDLSHFIRHPKYDPNASYADPSMLIRQRSASSVSKPIGMPISTHASRQRDSVAGTAPVTNDSTFVVVGSLPLPGSFAESRGSSCGPAKKTPSPLAIVDDGKKKDRELRLVKSADYPEYGSKLGVNVGLTKHDIEIMRMHQSVRSDIPSRASLIDASLRLHTLVFSGEETWDDARKCVEAAEKCDCAAYATTYQKQ